MSSNGSILILIINVFCHLHPKCTLKPSLTTVKVSHEKAVNYCKKVVVKNFGKFKRKQLRWSVFLNKAADLRPAILSRKDSNTGVFL